MYCKHCGNLIDEDSTFCKFCGKSQTIVNTVSKEVKQKHIEPVSLPPEKKPIDEPVKGNSITNPVYDISYKKEYNATIVGILLTILFPVFNFFIAPEIERGSSEFSLAIIIIFIWRLLATTWVVWIAERQNRSRSFWGIFTFFIPNIALIIIGLKRKFYSNYPLHYKEFKIQKRKDSCSLQFGAYEELYVKVSNEKRRRLYKKKSNGKYFVIYPEPISFASLDEYFTYLEKKNKL